MKLSEKQAIVMFDILKHSLQFVGGFCGYTTETLNKITNEIINQQSDELIQLDKEIEKGGDPCSIAKNAETK
jgi:hypothetical protein